MSYIYKIIFQSRPRRPLSVRQLPPPFVKRVASEVRTTRRASFSFVSSIAASIFAASVARQLRVVQSFRRQLLSVEFPPLLGIDVVP